MRRNARPREHADFALGRSVIRAGGVALLALAVAGAGLAIGLRAGAGEQPDRAGDLHALLARAGTAIVYSEFGENADTIWASIPSEPSDRVALGVAPHAPNFGVQPSMSPDGSYLAYTAASSPSSADLWLLDIATGNSRRLAEGVDLQAPVWSNDGAGLIARRSSGDENTPTSELLRVDLSGGVTPVASADGGLYPIDFDAAGALYYASLDASGADLYMADTAGTRAIAHLSDGITRDWDLSADGKRLAYLAPRAAGGFAANVFDLSTGQSGGIASDDGPAFSPVWSPNGSLTLGRPGELLDGTGVAGAAGDGFDVPLSWSPDGAILVVRHFEGESVADPGPSWLWSIDASGQRHRLSTFSDVVIAGWLESAP